MLNLKHQRPQREAIMRYEVRLHLPSLASLFINSCPWFSKELEPVC
jgi:hypothetical protein